MQLEVCRELTQLLSFPPRTKTLVYYKCQHFLSDAACIDGLMAPFPAPFPD